MINIDKLIRMANEFSEEYGSTKGMIDISISFGQKTVHLKNKAFKESFPVFETKKRDCDTYPFEHSFKFNDVKFFCLTEEDTL